MVTTRTGVVHALRQQFLADPAWPGDQHRRLPARGIDAAPTNHGLHRRRRLHDLVQRIARARALAAFVAAQLVECLPHIVGLAQGVDRACHHPAFVQHRAVHYDLPPLKGVHARSAPRCVAQRLTGIQFRDACIQRRADRQGRGTARQPLRSRIGRHDTTARIDRDDPFMQVLQDVRQGNAARLLGLLPHPQVDRVFQRRVDRIARIQEHAGHALLLRKVHGQTSANHDLHALGPQRRHGIARVVLGVVGAHVQLQVELPDELPHFLGHMPVQHQCDAV
ncbi:hypothetical protein G6F65_018798 [Rhizopus arrhizus]|nr:hypothetical protein G6F65_018798 [Rhizopus arrhizus]